MDTQFAQCVTKNVHIYCKVTKGNSLLKHMVTLGKPNTG